MPKPEAAGAPSFLVYALRDPIGANLDRVQIVKGWVDADGNTQEKVFDVAWSDDRQPDADGKLPPVGNTVDLKSASWTNTIGASELGDCLVRSRIRPGRACLLLCPHPGDPDAALVRL